MKRGDHRPNNEMVLSHILLLPFRLLLPPILETPMSTIRFPSTVLIVPFLVGSFGAIVVGAVYCWVSHPQRMALTVD
jgi:uncharacterized membrane protein